MNYIGSKLSLIDFLKESILNELEENHVENIEGLTFADLFAGTGVVGYSFKKKGMKIISNDIQYYSYVLNEHLIGNNEQLVFDGLKDEIPQLEHQGDSLDTVLEYLDDIEGVEGFIFNNYTREGTNHLKIQRMYFTEYNAKKCDAIRLKIEEWKKREKINEGEYFSLLACLIESIDRYANTASVYGAFLKDIKKTAERKMILDHYEEIIDNGKKNEVYNMDVNQLITQIEGDVLYLDPPYNTRQYDANYHILETIARYDNPAIKGITGVRINREQKSHFCSKIKARRALRFLIENAKFKYIFLSYNDEGIIPIEEIQDILKEFGEYKLLSKKYRRFKASNHIKAKRNSATEYLHCLIKEDL